MFHKFHRGVAGKIGHDIHLHCSSTDFFWPHFSWTWRLSLAKIGRFSVRLDTFCSSGHIQGLHDLVRSHFCCKDRPKGLCKGEPDPDGSLRKWPFFGSGRLLRSVFLSRSDCQFESGNDHTRPEEKDHNQDEQGSSLGPIDPEVPQPQCPDPAKPPNHPHCECYSHSIFAISPKVCERSRLGYSRWGDIGSQLWSSLKVKTKSFEEWLILLAVETVSTVRQGKSKCIKTLNGFRGCHENAINESCKMNPHLICLGWHPRSLYGQPLDQVWRVAGHEKEWTSQPRHGGSFRSSQSRLSHRILENHWEVFTRFLVRLST